jgi:hypothetical protein
LLARDDERQLAGERTLTESQSIISLNREGNVNAK